MKTTVNLWGGTAVSVDPTGSGGGVRLIVDGIGGRLLQVPMTPDQTGALIFGLEQAAEAASIAKEASQARPRYAYLGKCERILGDGKPCGLNAPCPDCGPSLIG